MAEFHTVRTYADFEAEVDAFARGMGRLLVVVGDPGVGKSSAFRSVFQRFPDPPEDLAAYTKSLKEDEEETIWDGDLSAEAWHWSQWDYRAEIDPNKPAARMLEGHVSPMSMFMNMFIFRNEVLVIDDVDSLYRDKTAVRLLKVATDSTPQRRLRWDTMSPFLKENCLPRAFDTHSRLCLIVNDWVTFDKNVAAVMDRAHLFHFLPSPYEVHKHVGTWIDHKHADVFQAIGERLPYVSKISQRVYVQAIEKKLHNMNWRAYVDHELSVPPATAALIRVLRDRHKHRTNTTRCRAWQDETGMSRAGYYRELADLRQRIGDEEVRKMTDEDMPAPIELPALPAPEIKAPRKAKAPALPAPKAKAPAKAKPATKAPAKATAKAKPATKAKAKTTKGK